MPLYRIDVDVDGSLDRDTEGLTLDHVGHARAQVVETILELRRERLKPGETRVLTVTARDEHGAAVYRETATLRGAAPNSDDAAVHRAIGAMDGRA